MRTEEIMSSPVVITQPNVKVSYLKDQFKRKNINAVPVIDSNGDISGIVSSSNLVGNHNNMLTVKEIMSTHVHVCAINSRVKDTLQTMLKYKIHHVIVMNDGDVVGMISSMDILKALASKLD